MRRFKRILCILLGVALVLSLLAVPALGTDSPEPEEPDGLPEAEAEAIPEDGAEADAEDGEPSPAALEYAASLCGVLGVSGEDAKHCAAAVRVMIASLKDINRDAIISASESWWLAFYLGESSISFLNNRCRVIACRVLPLSYQTFSWRHPNQCSYVKEGEIFASLKDNPNLTGKRKPGTKDFTASCNGWLYHFELNQVQYGVISYQNDNMNSIRAWVQKEVYK